MHLLETRKAGGGAGWNAKREDHWSGTRSSAYGIYVRDAQQHGWKMQGRDRESPGQLLAVLGFYGVILLACKKQCAAQEL